MTRRTDQRVADILDAIDRCRRYVGMLAADNPDLADMAEDAIERNLQIIGEAAKYLPPSVTDAHPEIAWPQIRGFRNILVHRYFGVERDVVPRRRRDPSLAAGRRAGQRCRAAVATRRFVTSAPSVLRRQGVSRCSLSRTASNRRSQPCARADRGD